MIQNCSSQPEQVNGLSQLCYLGWLVLHSKRCNHVNGISKSYNFDLPIRNNFRKHYRRMVFLRRGFSNSFRFLIIFPHSGQATFLSQISHANGFSQACFIKLVYCTSLFSQPSQAYCFSPAWHARCIFYNLSAFTMIGLKSFPFQPLYRLHKLNFINLIRFLIRKLFAATHCTSVHRSLAIHRVIVSFDQHPVGCSSSIQK